MVAGHDEGGAVARDLLSYAADLSEDFFAVFLVSANKMRDDDIRDCCHALVQKRILLIFMALTGDFIRLLAMKAAIDKADIKLKR